MLFPVIKIKDNDTGSIRIVGTSTHDTLFVSDNGGIGYYNLQNGCGSGETYSFQGVYRPVDKVYKNAFNDVCIVNSFMDDAIAK
jgi:hypothetical protein